mgnify:CR=1 FL=1
MGSLDLIVLIISQGLPLGNFLVLFIKIDGPHLHKQLMCKLPFEPIIFASNLLRQSNTDNVNNVLI